MIASSKIISILFFTLLAAHLTDNATARKAQELESTKCAGVNEIYTKCSSSSCFEDTCADLLTQPPQVCTKDCKTGCKCAKGYYRNSEGRCVDELTCSMCGYNENWVKGGKEVTCKGDASKSSTPGCQCIKGRYRSADGLCVDKDTCRSKCGSNEIYESCFSYCKLWEFTCKDAQSSPLERWRKAKALETKPCIKKCKIGCRCHPGFYRNRRGKCVAATSC